MCKGRIEGEEELDGIRMLAQRPRKGLPLEPECAGRVALEALRQTPRDGFGAMGVPERPAKGEQIAPVSVGMHQTADAVEITLVECLRERIEPRSRGLAPQPDIV